MSTWPPGWRVTSRTTFGRCYRTSARQRSSSRARQTAWWAPVARQGLAEGLPHGRIVELADAPWVDQLDPSRSGVSAFLAAVEAPSTANVRAARRGEGSSPRPASRVRMWNPPRPDRGRDKTRGQRDSPGCHFARLLRHRRVLAGDGRAVAFREDTCGHGVRRVTALRGCVGGHQDPSFSPSPSHAQMAGIMSLLRGSDTVELKLGVPPPSSVTRSALRCARCPDPPGGVRRYWLRDATLAAMPSPASCAALPRWGCCHARSALICS